MLLTGRLLLGLSLGGFWSMAAAISMKLVPVEKIPRALSIIFGGVFVAMVLAAPLGSALGAAVGWRQVFFSAAAIGIMTLVWQMMVMPAMPASMPACLHACTPARLRTLFVLLTRSEFRKGLLAMMLVFGGHFVFFTYLRPFLETVTHVSVTGVTFVLLGFGVANVLGTALSGPLIQRNLDTTLICAPALMAIFAFSLVAFGASTAIASILIATWGFAFGLIPVGWTSWMTRTVSDQMEGAGGLQVAAIQLSITLGAAMGGMLLDSVGIDSVFMGSGIVLVLAAAVCIGVQRSYVSRTGS